MEQWPENEFTCSWFFLFRDFETQTKARRFNFDTEVMASLHIMHIYELILILFIDCCQKLVMRSQSLVYTVCSRTYRSQDFIHNSLLLQVYHQNQS